jgi:hypothetical protein
VDAGFVNLGKFEKRDLRSRRVEGERGRKLEGLRAEEQKS